MKLRTRTLRSAFVCLRRVVPVCIRVETRTYQLGVKVRAGTPALQPAGRPALLSDLYLGKDLAG
jgi:hypothetical protein